MHNSREPNLHAVHWTLFQPAPKLIWLIGVRIGNTTAHHPHLSHGALVTFTVTLDASFDSIRVDDFANVLLYRSLTTLQVLANRHRHGSTYTPPIDCGTRSVDLGRAGTASYA